MCDRSPQFTPSITALPDNLVHRITAGEVLDSWASVVRELVENSLDAQASTIHLSLWPQTWRLRLVDNGMGMDLHNLRRAALPHSTSKLSPLLPQHHTSSTPEELTTPLGSDLEVGELLSQITSLGFRGQALHSLAHLSRLSLYSRTPGESQGWRVVYDHQGQPLQEDPVAMASGTVVVAEDLFAPWLGRRQALPKVSQQLRDVQTQVQYLALTHPHVTWQVEQNDRPWFQIRPGASPKALLPQWLPQVHPTDLVEYDRPLPWPSTPDSTLPGNTPPHLYLVLGLPSRCHRRRPDWVKVSVNHRIVTYPDLEQVIQAAFQRTLPKDRWPIALAQFQLPPAWVDWNRHPHKSEIYLHYLDHWQTQLRETIAQTLAQHPDSVATVADNQRVKGILRVAETSSVYRTDNPAPHPEVNPAGLKAIAQLHHMYIVAESPTGLCLVEQHIAHERVLYEQLQDSWELVPLSPPLILNHLSTAQVDQLTALGLACEPFGDQDWILREVPAPLHQRQDCAEALWELSLGSDLSAAQATIACRTALRNGTPLELSAMQTLLNQWQATRQPHTCPHGRPICLRLEETSLSRFFRRHWVVGKSHGAFPL